MSLIPTRHRDNLTIHCEERRRCVHSILLLLLVVTAAFKTMDGVESPSHVDSRAEAAAEEVHSPPSAGDSTSVPFRPSTIPTPERNSIAGVKPKESDPHFDHLRTGDDGTLYNVYKAVGPFTLDIPSEEVISLISVHESGPTWKELPAGRKASVFFRTWIEPQLPAHMAFTFNKQFALKFVGETGDKKRRGRPRAHDSLVVGYNGYCSAKKDGCPATFLAGFDEECMRALLQTPTPQTVKLQMEVTNACVHVKGRQFGGLRGASRQDVIDKYSASNMTPAEFAKMELEGVTDIEFHSSNRSKVLTREAVYNVAKEAKAKELVAAGLTACKLSNIMIVHQRMKSEDIAERRALGDDSNDVLGMLHHVELVPNFRMHLWTKPSCMIFHYMCKTDQCVVNIDLTGQLLNFPSVPHMKDKVLHTIFSISPKYAIVPGQHMQDERVSRMFSPLILAEMVSNKNKAGDMVEFYRGFLDGANTVVPGEETGLPLLCLTDCAAALQSAALKAFASPLRTSDLTRMEYGNHMLIYLLHYDKLVADIESGDTTLLRKDVASRIVKDLKERRLIVVFLKECKSHVCRAPPAWIRRQKGSDYPQHLKARVEDVLSHVFSKITKDNSIAHTMVQFAIVVALFETKRFDVMTKFDDGMETKEHKGQAEIAIENSMTRVIDGFVRNETQKLWIQSMDDVDEWLSDSGAIKRQHIVLHDGIVDRAKILMKKQGCVYLKGVSLDNNDGDSGQKVGTLRLSIVYGCSVDPGDGTLDAWKEGGFDISVTLPFDGVTNGIANPLYSLAVAHYLRTTWMTKPAFWCRGVIDLINNAMDMDIEDSNQHSEGVIRAHKHDKDMFKHVSEPADYVLQRWADSRRCSKQFIEQYNSLPGKIEAMEIRRANKKKRGRDETVMEAPAARASLTQDEINQQREEDEGEKWNRHGSRDERDAALRNALNETFLEKGKISESQKHKYLCSFVNSKIPEMSHLLMSYPPFNDFMRDKVKAKRGLSDDHRAVLQAFVNKIHPGKPAATDSVQDNVEQQAAV